MYRSNRHESSVCLACKHEDFNENFNHGIADTGDYSVSCPKCDAGETMISDIDYLSFGPFEVGRKI